MSRTSVAAVGLVSVLLMASACGGKASAPKGHGGVVTVVEGDIFLDKPEYRVTNGPIQISVSNNGKLHHDLRVRNQPLFIESVGGETKSATITLPKGTYELFCSITGHTSAKASLIVE
jgi:hypothetical protein